MLTSHDIVHESFTKLICNYKWYGSWIWQFLKVEAIIIFIKQLLIIHVIKNWFT